MERESKPVETSELGSRGNACSLLMCSPHMRFRFKIKGLGVAVTCGGRRQRGVRRWIIKLEDVDMVRLLQVFLAAAFPSICKFWLSCGACFQGVFCLWWRFLVIQIKFL